MAPEIKEPILLEGKAYSIINLLDHCAEQALDPAVPPWRKEVLAFMSLFLDEGDEAIIQLSSGTTGDPKSYTLSREAMMNSAKKTLGFFGLRKGEKALLCLPVSYIAGKMMVVRALLGGLDLILQEPSSRPLMEAVEDIAFAATVPMQVEESLRQGDPLDRISRLLIGGGELHPETRKKLSSLNTPELYESFGMTETCTHFALRRINGPVPDPFFRILEGVRIGTDPRGCLEVEVPGVTRAPVQTNDLVEINEQGDGFTWLGRFDNMINTGGIKIIPELLEEQVRESLGHECLILQEPDRKLGNKLVLMIEYNGEYPPLDAWMKQLRNSLSGYEIPKRIVTVKVLPRNRSMKPDRTRALDHLL